MAKKTNYRFVMDPLKFASIMWPHVRFYKQQQQMIYSVAENDETFVPAGNMLGKDFTAAFIVVWFFVTRRPCRVVTTSAKDDHLRVLWGEINRFVNDAKYPLRVGSGGPLVVQHQQMFWEYEGTRCPLSYVTGMVASDATLAAMQGHHIPDVGDGIPRNLFVSDESSSVPDEYWMMARTWAKRMFAIGNTWPCENFFKHAVHGKPGTNDKGGDIPRPVKAGEAPGSRGYWRKIIRIKATDSPNVRLALEQKARGMEPTNELIVDGVKSWEEYQKNLAMWDEIQQTVSLEAEWYEGRGVKLFPKEWLNRAGWLSNKRPRIGRKAKGIGVDTAEGGDNTAMVGVDDLGIIKLNTKKTPDTDIIAGELIAFMRELKCPANRVCIDRGGGGKQLADRVRVILKRMIQEEDWTLGWNVRTIFFGEGVTMLPHSGGTTVQERIEVVEERYTYKNRRAQMYHELSLLEDFAIPSLYPQFREQLAPIPKMYDGEGKIVLLPKGKKSPDSKEPTLTQLIGHSPDEADALVLAVHAMLHRSATRMAGAL